VNGGQNAGSPQVQRRFQRLRYAGQCRSQAGSIRPASGRIRGWLPSRRCRPSGVRLLGDTWLGGRFPLGLNSRCGDPAGGGRWLCLRLDRGWLPGCGGWLSDLLRCPEHRDGLRCLPVHRWLRGGRSREDHRVWIGLLGCNGRPCLIRLSWVGPGWIRPRVNSVLGVNDRSRRDRLWRAGFARAEDDLGGAGRDGENSATGQRNAGRHVPHWSQARRWRHIGLVSVVGGAASLGVGTDPGDQGSGWRSGTRLTTMAVGRSGHKVSTCVMVRSVTDKSLGVDAYSASAPPNHPGRAAPLHRPSRCARPTDGQ
jgi:hypothetical protein